MNIRNLAALAAVLALTLGTVPAIHAQAITGGQAQPGVNFIPLPITEQRNAAVGYALTSAQLLNSLLGICERLDESTAVRVKAAWANWEGRNAPYVEASRGWVLHVRNVVITRQGQDAGAAVQAKIMGDIAANARAGIADVLPDGEPKMPICESAIMLASDPARDLRASKQFGADLEDIYQFHRSLLERAAPAK